MPVIMQELAEKRAKKNEEDEPVAKQKGRSGHTSRTTVNSLAASGGKATLGAKKPVESIGGGKGQDDGWERS